MGLGGGTPAAAVPAPAVDPLADLMGLGGGGAPAAAPALPVLLDAGKGNGLEISGRLVAGPAYELTFTNRSQAPLDSFMIQTNKNSFGLAAAGALQVPPVAPGGSQ